MTGFTRRGILGLAGAAVLGACTTPERNSATTHLVFVTKKDGVYVLDQNGYVVVGPVDVPVSTPTWSHMVTAQSDGASTRVIVEDMATRRVLSSNRLAGRLEPRAVSSTGDLVASVTPGGAGRYGLWRPAGRARTEIAVSGLVGERTRFDLPGNLEPDVFSPDGTVLFVLDYLPAARPERVQVAAVDLTTGRLRTLRARSGEPQPEPRTSRIDRLYDERRSLLFSLYAYEPDAIAYVDCLHTVEGWTHRVDLPAPLGQERAGVHGIALSPTGDRLCVVHTPSASAVDIDPDRLVVTNVTKFAATGRQGKPTALFAADGRLIVNVDEAVIVANPRREFPMPGEARGLALSDDDVWAGHPDGVVRYNVDTGTEVARLTVPDLYVVKRVRRA